MINIGNNKNMLNEPIFCLLTISIKLKDPAHAATGRSKRATDTSYEISCAADLNPPKNAYFELLDQPAPITP